MPRMHEWEYRHSFPTRLKSYNPRIIIEEVKPNETEQLIVNFREQAIR